MKLFALFSFVFTLAVAPASGQTPTRWVTSWAASIHGPYPVGNASAQPSQQFTFPAPAREARDQTFRLIVRPDIWGPQARLRLSNAFGARPLTVDDVHVGLQWNGPALVPGSNRAVTFAGKTAITIEPGHDVWSDAVDLPSVQDPAALIGRKLAVSFHVVGESGPMSWHAKALTTSYVTAPGAGRKGGDEDEAAFPFSTTSWFFLDAVDMRMPADTKLVVAFGDSITDGTSSTLNGDDRWPDVLSRRLHRQFGRRVAVVNAGIGGNQVAGPATYTAESPFSGGPSAGDRLERDVLSLSGVSTIIWLEGINDFGHDPKTPVDTVTAAMRADVVRLRARIPHVTICGGHADVGPRQLQPQLREP